MAISCEQAASRIFDYPGDDYLDRVTEFERVCRDVAPAAAECVSAMLAQFSQLTLNDLRELYTRTFDLTPVCALYVSVHLFGEGNFKRAQLMTGLAELYASKGIASRGELPDHLGVMLGALEQLEQPERRELLQHCLKTGLEKMRAELARQDNPYVLAITALERLVATWMVKAEVFHD